MNDQLNISNGPSFKYFYIGTICLIICVIVLSLSENLWFLGWIGMPFSILIILSLTGTSLDFSKKRIKHYFNFLVFKIGQWQDLSQFTRVELLLNHNSQVLNSRGMSNTVRVRSFYISLVNSNNERIEVKEFTDYKAARKMLDQLSEKLGIEKIDRKELIIQKNTKNRSRR